MQLSKFTDYAFRVLMYVSRHQDELHTIAGLAEKLNVSQNHLVKVVHFMAKQHWLITMRGKGGGIKVSAAALAIGDATGGTASPHHTARSADSSHARCSSSPCAIAA